MRGWRALAGACAMACTLIAGACNEAGSMQQEQPQVPAILIDHEEPPIGDRLNHRLVRAMTATLDRLEPEWGRFSGRIYTIDPGNVAQLPEELAAGMPPGWAAVDLRGFAPPDGEVHAFADGDRMFAALVIDPGEFDVTPVMILRNEALGPLPPDSAAGSPR